MLESLIVLLVLLWLVGLLTSYSFGGLIHILLLLAIVVFVIRLLRGRQV